MIVARPSELAGIAQEQAGDLVDLGPGQPDPSLLPFGLVRRHLDRALARYGAGALAYGANAGPLPAREALAAWASETEDGDFRAEQVLVVAGATQGIDLICTRMARPGDAVLVQRTTYNLALELFRGRGIEAVPVGDDLAAPTGEDLVRAASEVTSRGKRVAFAYVVPTCHNPTGVSLTAGQRLDLLGGAREAGILIVEDDPYRVLSFGDPPAPTIAALAGEDGVVAVRTLSKLCGPGLRLGFLIGEEGWIDDFSVDPLFRSGGGIAHLASLVLPTLLSSPAFARHVARLRDELEERCRALRAALAPAAACGAAAWRDPAGGLFLWVSLRPPATAGSVVERAAVRGVRILPGKHWFAEAGGESTAWLRISFSGHSADVLADAGARIAEAIVAAYRGADA